MGCEVLLWAGAGLEFAGLTWAGAELHQRGMAHGAPAGWLLRRLRRLRGRDHRVVVGSATGSVGTAFSARGVARPAAPQAGSSETEWRSYMRAYLERIDEDLGAVHGRVDQVDSKVRDAATAARRDLTAAMDQLRRASDASVVAEVTRAWKGLYLAAAGAVVSLAGGLCAGG